MIIARKRLLVAGVALAAGCLAFGAKLTLVRVYGSDLPYWDAWDAVGRALLIPRSLGELHPVDFLRPQNEHRIVLSRLISYALAVSNGQWDPLLEMTVNAAIHAALCAALVVFARRFAAGFAFAGAAVALVSLFVLPFDWENTLQGLQSQFYLLVWGAFGMFLLCVPSAPLSGRWWAGFLVGVASLGTMSSGFFASGVVLLLLCGRCAINRSLSRREVIAGALLAALCVVGALAINHVPGHDPLRSHSPWAWLGGMATALSWPEMGWPIAFVVLQLPVVLLAASRLRARQVTGDEAVLIALAVWAWTQVAAVAYARANLGMVLSPRYMDLYAIGSAANIIALALLCRTESDQRTRLFFAALWITLFACGLKGLDRDAYSAYLDRLPAEKAAERRRVRSYLATGDLAALRAAPPAELPHPNAELLGAMLADAGIRAMLPLGVRPPVELSPEPGSDGFEPASPAELPLDQGGRAWIARRGPARFVSAPLPADALPYLHIAVCGSPALNASALHLESANDIEPAEAFPLQGERWHLSDIPVPRNQSVRVVVDIPPGDHWFAFAEPVELGGESWFDRWVLRRSAGIAGGSALLFGAALAALLAVDLRRREWW